MRRPYIRILVLGVAGAVVGLLLWAGSEHPPSIVAQDGGPPRPLTEPTSPTSRPATGNNASPAQQATPKRQLPGEALVDIPNRLPVDCNGTDCGECQIASDCLPEYACLADPETRRFRCVRDECESDGDCPAGLQCRRVLTLWSWVDTIGRCLPPGTKVIGDTCAEFSTADTCGADLLCYYGRCLSKCAGTAGECGDGADCLEGNVGKACVPKCRDCPNGSVCIQHATGGECYALKGTDCRAGGPGACADGEECGVWPSVSTKAIQMSCHRLCDPSAPAIGTRVCPEGEVCGWGTPGFCYKKCDPKNRSSCPEGQSCGTVTEDMKIWGCTER